MSNPILRAGLLAGGFVAVSTVVAYSTGALPGAFGALGVIAPTVTRGIPTGLGCGQCHGLNFGQNGFRASFTPSKRSLDAAEVIKAQTMVSGGVASNWGGFCAETTQGTWVAAGPDTKPDASGKFISHTTRLNRTWGFTLMAGTTPGPFEVYMAANTVNGNGLATGDIWGFHTFDPLQPVSTPIMMYVNAKGVTSAGDGCVGSFGNWPVLGARTSPTVGSTSFGFELVGAHEASPAVLLIGLRRAFPIPLDFVGVTGCGLWVDPIVSIPGLTGPGAPQQGQGVARFAMPIPPGTAVGIKLGVQAAIIDVNNGRPTPVTMSNAVEMTTL